MKSALEISDLASRNGTFVDDVRVDHGKVSSGQVVRFGNARFVVIVEDLELAQASSEEETDNPSHEVDGNGLFLPPLSDAQRRVFDLLICGLPEKTISQRLKISKHTVHTHTGKIFKLFGVHSRSELVALLFKL